MSNWLTKPIVVGEPVLDVLRPVDFAWQAFQAGQSFAKHGNTHAGVHPTDAAHEAFVNWWNDHPQVKP